MSDLPSRARVVCDHGPLTCAAVEAAHARIERAFPPDGSELYEVLETSLLRWGTDDQAAPVISTIEERLDRADELSVRDLRGWLEAHPGDPDAVSACLSILPPDDVAIVRRLTQTGSQKTVFQAKWRASDRDVVVKQFLPEFEDAWERELESFPLHLRHPNIIETYVFQNRRGERFLVERLLRTLSDQWQAPGEVELANLVYHTARALTVVHAQGRIHCDVKADNVGRDGSRYILLDFGVSRRAEPGRDAERPMPAYSGTGSLRTQAPEVLAGAANSAMSDVWALGATAFNARFGQYPLLDHGEGPPPVTDEIAREEFREELSRRAAEEWDSRVVSRLESEVPSRLLDLVRTALDRTPTSRPSARELVASCETQLPQLVRTDGTSGAVDPATEIDQLAKFLPFDERTLRSVPAAERARIVHVINEAGRGASLGPAQRANLEALQDRLRLWGDE
jgi:Protein kinase domain